MTDVLTVAWAARSEIGRAREQNEDACFGKVQADSDTGTPRGLFIVCDGMGGHLNGEEASALAVSILRDRLDWTLKAEWPSEAELVHRLQDAVRAANRAICDQNDRAARQGKERAGTTLALLVLSGPDACVVHVGDSRVYQATRERTILLTTDHNIGNREVRHGVPAEDAWARSDARHLTQALGPFPEDQIHPGIQWVRIKEDSLFLLCTDGISDNHFVETNECHFLRPLLVPAAELSAGCQALVEAANTVNGHDNLTAVLVRVSGLGGGSMGTGTAVGEKSEGSTSSRRGNWLHRLLRRRQP